MNITSLVVLQQNEHEEKSVPVKKNLRIQIISKES